MDPARAPSAFPSRRVDHAQSTSTGLTTLPRRISPGAASAVRLEHRTLCWESGGPQSANRDSPSQEVDHGRNYSMDLRQRVVSRVAGGQSRRGVADDLSVNPSFSVKLVAPHERTGSFEPASQALGTGKLDPCRACLIGRVTEKRDVTMPELAAELAARHGVEVDPASLSWFLHKAGLSYEKHAAGQRAHLIWCRQGAQHRDRQAAPARAASHGRRMSS
jgi:transposase